jgi:hypothetical protein
MKPCNDITICDQPPDAYVHDPYGIENDSHHFVRGICAPLVLHFPDRTTLRYLQREAPNAPLAERTYDLKPGGLMLGVADEDDKVAIIVTVQARTPEVEKLWAKAGLAITDEGIVNLNLNSDQAPVDGEGSVG